MMRLGFPSRGNKSGASATESASSAAAALFSNITSTAMSITGSGSSIVHGSSAMERAAATAAANAQASSAASGSSSAAAGESGPAGDGDDLPPGWRLVTSRSNGRDYYLHLATNARQWDKPTEAEPKGGAEPAARGAGVFTSGVSNMRAGLTSMFSQANSRLQTTLTHSASTASNNSSSSSRALGASGGPRGTTSTDADRDSHMQVEVFENERLDGKLQPGDPKRFSDRLAAPGSGSDAMPEGELPPGHEWVSDWEVDAAYTAADRDGWTYAADFAEIVRLARDELSHASRHPTDAVRRRRWVRYRQALDDAGATSSATMSPREPSEPKALGAWSDAGDDAFADADDDPFRRAAHKQQSGFRVNMKFPHRGGKDATKDYQSLGLGDVLWLVNAHDVPRAPADELLREKTANLEEQIKDATARSVALERELRAQHDAKAKDLAAQHKKFEALVAQYRKVARENETLQLSVAAHRSTVEALRKEATEKDMLANEEQRALNAEMAAANQALEEKAKALATARMRYKRDNKALAASLEAAKKRLEAHKAKANEDAQDPLAKELKTEMDKVRQLHAKLEAVRQHRLAVEEESKALFNQVVEKKADLKFKSKKKMETALKDVDAKIETLKTEQAELTKKLAQKPGDDELRKLNARRNDIRSELGALKERRTMLLAEKRKQEGVEL